MSDFSKRVASIYASMRRRTEEKRFRTGRFAGRVRRHGVSLDFTAKDLEHWLLARHVSPETPYPCRYCRRWITLIEAAVDHMVPLRRGGSPGLENLDTPCASCNDVKGKLTPEEFTFFLEKMYEMAARFGNQPVTDITSRLEKAVKLAAGAWHYRQREERKQAAAVLEDF